MSVSHPWFCASLWTASVWWRVWHGLLLGTPGPGLGASKGSTWRGRQVARWLGGDSWTEEEWHTFLDQFDEPERARAAHLLYYLNGTTDFPKVTRGKYRRIVLEAPALVLHGERYKAYLPWRPEDYRPYAPNLIRQVVPGAGHALVEDRPDVVLEKIRQFLLRD
jgi:pimeloyl-ACP methyl ester carboxylesterase